MFKFFKKKIETPEPVQVVPEVKEEAKKEEKSGGLKKRFRNGEMIAWKGVWFKVTRVGYLDMEISAHDFTHEMKQFLKDTGKETGGK